MVGQHGQTDGRVDRQGLWTLFFFFFSGFPQSKLDVR
jgi:hypothetical protein